MINVIAKFTVKPGEKDKVLALFEKLIGETRKEAGCGSYQLKQATADENLLVVLEEWADKEAVDSHSASEHFTTIVPQIVGLCAGAPSIETFVHVM